MRFALLIWHELVDAGSPPTHEDQDALDSYLAALRAEVASAELVWFAMAPTAQWTDGEPHDAVVRGRGPRQPSFDPTDLYSSIELSGILTVDCADEQAALLWASRFPFIASIEVRRISPGAEGDALLSPSVMREVARGYWANPIGLASRRVDDIIANRHDLVPGLLKALADTAPPGELHMIGVGPLESLSMSARHNGVEDRTLDLLIEADIPAAALVEILSGPWPEYLEGWNASERLKGVLSDSQLAEIRARSGPGAS
jgi:hypothetical protein